MRATSRPISFRFDSIGPTSASAAVSATTPLSGRCASTWVYGCRGYKHRRTRRTRAYRARFSAHLWPFRSALESPIEDDEYAKQAALVALAAVSGLEPARALGPAVRCPANVFCA